MLSGNIRVFCRCRPLSKSEAVAGCASIMEFDAAKDGDLVVNGPTKKSFKFDRVYSPKDDQGMKSFLEKDVAEENIIPTLSVRFSLIQNFLFQQLMFLLMLHQWWFQF